MINVDYNIKKYSYNEAMEKVGAHIRLKLDTDQPVALTDFVSNFVGISNQFDKFIAKHHPEYKSESEIYIKEVRTGCIEADLISWVFGGAITTMGAAAFTINAIDQGQILSKFINSLKIRVSPYFKKGGRTKNVKVSDLNDFLKVTKSIARDQKGRTSLEAAIFEDGERNVRAAFTFTSKEAINAEQEINNHKIELEDISTAEHQRVMMRFVRPSVEPVKSHRRTGERALIESLHPKPLAIMYASDMARERIQHELKDADANPFNLLFDVDVNVETSKGKPAVFRIVGMHDVTDAPDDD